LESVIDTVQAQTVSDEPFAPLEGADLAAASGTVRAALTERGVGFGGGDELSPFVVDPVPRIVAAEEWVELRRGLAQRGRALAAFVADVYGERSIVAAGVVPARVVETAEHLEPDLAGRPARGNGWVAGLDLVRGADGVMRVLEDNLRTPSGIAYALAARDAVDAVLPGEPPPRRLDGERALGLLGDALRTSAPTGDGEPTVVLLSDGPSNSAWYEHRALAARLGIPLVRPDALLTRDGRLCARDAGGVARPVDVVYRRTDQDRLRDDDGRPTWLAEKLLEPLLAGNVAVVNPFGTGVADDKLSHVYVEDMVRFYLDEEPLIESVRSYDLGDDDVLARIDELVVKPRGGYGGAGVVVCPHATDADRATVRDAVERDPERYVAQELVEISTCATVVDGRLEPRHVDLRPYVIGVGTLAVTAPVALTRVALKRGSLVVNSSQNGGGKDTWLLG
jgi:uncharacterized circularly permuted ATP-grasp superfamily protein